MVFDNKQNLQIILLEYYDKSLLTKCKTNN